ncbi:MAG TPA: hypothetical protein VGS19_37490, partial [Streptosporangiaceae bacterium]|nr:hypothetical protein [Streptosporangiaceae bacterium]
MRIRLWLAVVAAAAVGVMGASLPVQPAGAAMNPTPSAVRLKLSQAVQHHLLTLFATQRHIPLADFAPLTPSVVLAAGQSNGDDWAMIHFVVTVRAPLPVVAGLQDGGGTEVFTRLAGHPWALAGLGGQPAGCAVHIPLPVRHVWGLGSCQLGAAAPAPARATPTQASTVERAGTIEDLVSIAKAQDGVADDPPDSTSFGSADCDPYTTLVGNPLGAPDCGRTESHSPWFSNVETHGEAWCADFTKWV